MRGRGDGLVRTKHITLKQLDPPVVLGVKEQLLWCAALTYFGIFFAVPLRRQTILVEKLKFPSGTATAKLIQLLHSSSASSRELLSYDPELEEEDGELVGGSPAAAIDSSESGGGIVHPVANTSSG